MSFNHSQFVSFIRHLWLVSLLFPLPLVRSETGPMARPCEHGLMPVATPACELHLAACSRFNSGSRTTTPNSNADCDGEPACPGPVPVSASSPPQPPLSSHVAAQSKTDGLYPEAAAGAQQKHWGSAPGHFPSLLRTPPICL